MTDIFKEIKVRNLYTQVSISVEYGKKCRFYNRRTPTAG